MKYLLFVILLVSLIITAGCVGENKNTVGKSTPIPTPTPTLVQMPAQDGGDQVTAAVVDPCPSGEHRCTKVSVRLKNHKPNTELTVIVNVATSKQEWIPGCYHTDYNKPPVCHDESGKPIGSWVPYNPWTQTISVLTDRNGNGIGENFDETILEVRDPLTADIRTIKE